MQRELIIKSRSLGGSSDLTLLAPIRPGFIDSLESITYKTRVKRVLEALHGARQSTHEYKTARLLSDSIERVGVILSVRVAVIEPEDKVLLVVTFDGNWESYIRVLWDKVGTLLDLIFCSTVDYVNAYEHRFDEWLEWARRVQLETGFFYGPPDTTAKDALYMRRIERMSVRGAGGELQELRASQPSAEDAVERFTNFFKDGKVDDDPPIALPSKLERMVHECIVNGLQGLAALYRLVDLYRPGTNDGETLRRASVDLLLEFVKLWAGRSPDVLEEIDKAKNRTTGRFNRQIEWLFPDGQMPQLNVHQKPAPADTLPNKVSDSILSEIQGGIVRPYAKITHGASLFVAFSDTAAAANLIAWSLKSVTHGAQPHDVSTPKDPFVNVAFTPSGLRALSMDEETLTLFPEDFRQGMAGRAGLLGDVRNNHPRRWRLPRRMTSLDTPPSQDAHQVVEMEAIHAVVLLRCEAPQGTAQHVEIHDSSHPLHDFSKALLAANSGVELLTAQSMLRRYRTSAPQTVEEHFGYADGNGQPDFEANKDSLDENREHLGEVVHGHDNAADLKLELSDPNGTDAARERLLWLNNGSFLVLRKYRQFVDRLEQAVTTTADEMAKELRDTTTDFKKIVYAKLMGRDQDGVPLVKKSLTNKFDYEQDLQGAKCPLHAHIRLAHPRADKTKTARPPRIVRRSMSYGSTHSTGTPDDIDRGLMFMAYNTSISEQFEVVQRWLAGGNSTGSSSGQSCPIVGVPENGFPRNFRFEYEHASGTVKVFRVKLENTTHVFDQPEVLTELQWGMYLFAPSLKVLGKLQALAKSSNTTECPVPWDLKRGRELIASLVQLEVQRGRAVAVEAWKGVIEDPESIDRLESAAVWAAIREDHAGFLKTPYGTLIANGEMALEVLSNPDSCYSICGQLERMKRSFGEIYLGLDAGPRYDDESEPINTEIGKLTKSGSTDNLVYTAAYTTATNKICQIIEDAREQASKALAPKFEVTFDAREVVDEVLGDLCDRWFGLQDSPHLLERGGVDWAWTEDHPPLYPGHFTALSRYMFQPNPGPTAIELGERYGRALRVAMGRFVDEHRLANKTPRAPDGSDAPIAQSIFEHPTHGTDNDWVARTMVGVLMGFIAPIIGAVLNVLREWHRDASFADVRLKLGGHHDYATAVSALAKPIRAAACMRPMPQIIWRTVRKAHNLRLAEEADYELTVGEKVVLALVSGTQESLQNGTPDTTLMFGGVRSKSPPGPTHACPGYLAGMEAMLGTLTAILAREETMRPGPTPLTFLVEGPCNTASRFRTALKLDAKSKIRLEEFTHQNFQELVLTEKLYGENPAAEVDLPKNPTPREGLILAVGDSWVGYPKVPVITWPPAVFKDLRDHLLDFSYSIPDVCCDWKAWGTAEILEQRIIEIQKEFKKILGNPPQVPKAVLISAGGNDSTYGVMESLIAKNDGDPKTPTLDLPELEKHIAKLKKCYTTVITGIKATLEGASINIPIIVHGYDHPIPNGPEGSFGDDWLLIPFKHKGYDASTGGKDEKEATQAMKDLIVRLNKMLKDEIADDAKFKAFVRYVDLQGTIAHHWPSDPINGWYNDLHPTNNGFKAMAIKIDAMVQATYP